MNYNGSELTKEEWEWAEQYCKNDDKLLKIWDGYKTLHSGRVKDIIITYDKYIKFVQAAVDIICSPPEMGEVSDEDKEFYDLVVGAEDDDAYSKLKYAAHLMLKDKDDKRSERIKGMLTDLGKYPLMIEELMQKLGPDDQEIVQESRQMKLAKKVALTKAE